MSTVEEYEQYLHDNHPDMDKASLRFLVKRHAAKLDAEEEPS